MTLYGVKDEYSPLRRVLVRRPGSEFADPEEYEKWGYRGTPDLETAREEHDKFTALLRAEGVEVIYQKEVHPSKREALFTRDASIMTPRGAMLCRSGCPLRRGEEEYAGRAFRKMDIPILGEVQAPATVDGGDTLWLDDDTFLVGHSYRTNEKGYLQVQKLLREEMDVEVIQMSLPHFKGPEKVLHLMSLISPVDEDLAVVYPELAPVKLMKLLDEKDINIVEVPEEEFESMGTNVLALSPRVVLIHAGNPTVSAGLRQKGCRVLQYTGERISLLPEGGPTCLTRPLLRK